MHEFSLIQNIFNIINQVAAEHQLHIVTKAHLKIGKLRQVVPEFLEFAFTQIAKGTIAEGAALQITEIPLRVRCQNCQREFAVTENVYICPHCDSGGLEIITGKEFILENIEGDQ